MYWLFVSEDQKLDQKFGTPVFVSLFRVNDKRMQLRNGYFKEMDLVMKLYKPVIIKVHRA